MILTPDTSTGDLAELLRGMMFESSLRFAEIAEHVGCSRQTVSNIARGEGLDSAIRLLRVLDALGWRMCLERKDL